MVETKKIVDYIIVILIIGTIFLLGFYFVNTRNGEEDVVQNDFSLDLFPGQDPQLTNTNAGIELSSVELSRLVNEIKLIELDTSFFESNAFRRLRDNTVDIISQPSGISNPFIRL